MKDPVIIGIATMESRRESLRETLDSLEGQYDKVIVYANDYDHPSPARGESVSYCSGMGDIGDIGKFYIELGPFFYRPDNYYIFTCDDDLIYPPNYVETMIEAIERHDRKAVVSAHGREYYGPVMSYYRTFGLHLQQGRAKNFRCLDAVAGPDDHPVTTVGTGVAAWHSSLFRGNPLTMADFPHRNMADILFSKKCNDLGIPRYVIPHAAGWINHSDKVNVGMDTISAQRRFNDQLETEVFNSVEWKLWKR